MCHMSILSITMKTTKYQQKASKVKNHLKEFCKEIDSYYIDYNKKAAPAEQVKITQNKALIYYQIHM